MPQRPFVKGLEFVASYAYNYERRQEWFDDLAQYKVLTSGGKEGWEWRPTADVPTHRFTGAVTWHIGTGARLHHAHRARLRGRRSARLARHAILLGPLLFTTSYAVSGNPKLENPTRDQWFDTSMFAILADTNTPRTNLYYYDGLVGPSWSATDMTLTKVFSLGRATGSRPASRPTTRSTRSSGTTPN